MAGKRASTAGRFFLQLDGETWPLSSFRGGTITGSVVGAPDSAGVVRKRVAGLVFEPFVVEVGLPLGEAVRRAATAMLDRTARRQTGTIVAADYVARALSYLDFRDALLTEVAIPTLDGTSKESGLIAITFSAERITRRPGDGAKVTPAVTPTQKAWLTSNFRLRLGNLPTNRVSRIDAFTIRQLMPAGVEYPNLRVTLSAVDAQPWQQWFDDFVIAGKNTKKDELPGSIELLDASRKEVLAAIELAQVGIFGLERDIGAGGDALARIRAALYVEEMKLLSAR
jgi:hypothetical protein